MKKRIAAVVSALALLAVSGGTALAWHVEGTVLCPNKTPFEGVVIHITGSSTCVSSFSATATTDGSGSFFLSLPDCDGTYTATIDTGTLPADAVVSPSESVGFSATDALNFAVINWTVDSSVCQAPCPCVVGEFGSVNLGHASKGVVIGLNGTKIKNSNVTLVGDEYVSQGGSLVNMAPSTINGNVYEYANGQYSGPGKRTGTVNVSPALLAQVNADALNAAAAAKALAATHTFGTISSPLTVIGNGGLNVIKINGNIKASLILSGSSSDVFIVNVTGTLTLGGSSVLGLAGGVTANNVLYNFIGSSGSIQTHVGNVVNGTLLAPNYNFDLDGVFNGALIGGGSGKTIVLMSGAKANQPTCPPCP